MNGVIASAPELAALKLAREALGQGFHAEALDCYRDAEGDPFCWRIRCRHPNGSKWVRPMWVNEGRYAFGEPPAPSGGKPLFRLPELLMASPAVPVWVTEGEGCANALTELGLVATTSGGSTSAEAADWAPLKGRRVRLWPDNDDPGLAYARTVTEILGDVQVIAVDQLGLRDKGDCVDWLRANPNATVADVEALPIIKSELGGSPPDSPRVILERGSDVIPVPIDWLWTEWLAKGKFHLIGGAPGTGKTTIATALAAVVTTGGTWPDGSRATSGDVVIWSGEDDNADTLNPRFRAAGADMKRVHMVAGVEEASGRYRFDPARDMDVLREAMRNLADVRLIVVDPVVSAISGDSHKNAEVRRGLQPLVDLASEFGCAVLGITHFSKGTGGRDPVERITGSLAFGALARLVMVTVKQEANGAEPERRLLMRAKSNIGPDGGGFTYELLQGELDGYPGVHASRAIWGAPVQGSARELLVTAESGESRASASSEAEEWLGMLLANAPMPVAEVAEQARALGHSAKALRRARERLGVRTKKAAIKDGPWVLYLPKVSNAAEDALPLKGAPLDSSGIFALNV